LQNFAICCGPIACFSVTFSKKNPIKERLFSLDFQVIYSSARSDSLFGEEGFQNFKAAFFYAQKPSPERFTPEGSIFYDKKEQYAIAQ
jgi:hypothetical protein